MREMTLRIIVEKGGGNQHQHLENFIIYPKAIK